MADTARDLSAAPQSEPMRCRHRTRSHPAGEARAGQTPAMKNHATISPSTSSSHAVPEMSVVEWKSAVLYPSESATEEAARDFGEHRCLCGRLLFRLTEQGVVLKCQRCKRTAVLRLPELAATLSQLSARDPASSASPAPPPLAEGQDASAAADIPSAAASTTKKQTRRKNT